MRYTPRPIIDATLELGMGDGEGGLQCSEVITLTGEPL